jgi:hypothetical protein
MLQDRVDTCNANISFKILPTNILRRSDIHRITQRLNWLITQNPNRTAHLAWFLRDIIHDFIVEIAVGRGVAIGAASTRKHIETEARSADAAGKRVDDERGRVEAVGGGGGAGCGEGKGGC